MELEKKYTLSKRITATQNPSVLSKVRKNEDHDSAKWRLLVIFHKCFHWSGGGKNHLEYAQENMGASKQTPLSRIFVRRGPEK